MALVSPAEYARHKGVSRASVTYAIRDGRISTVKDPSTGKEMLDPAVADVEWANNTHHEKRRNTKEDANEIPLPLPTQTGGGQSKKENSIPAYSESRALKEAFNARLAKLEYEEKQGKLIPADKVRSQAFKVARVVRDNILNIPDRLAAELAGETDPQVVYQKLHQELLKALDELSRMEF